MLLNLKFIYLIVNLATTILAKPNNNVKLNYIMTPKQENVHLLSDSFLKEHNINNLATFNDYSIYKVNPENYIKYKSTLNEIFEVERDQMIYLNYIESPKRNSKKFKIQGQNNHQLNHFMINIPWHLDRIDEKESVYDNQYRYNMSGSCHQNENVHIDTYVIDTGIDKKHDEFNGRVTWLANFVDNMDIDCQSHGTHCAGIVGSQTYGVCKDANLFAIKVLDCRGSGSLSGVIQGIEYAYQRHLEESEKSDKIHKSIISMSLGGGYSKIVNTAVEKTLENEHFYVVVAAGNEDNDACKVSPASANGVLTVMASDRDDTRAYFSNYGKCADIYAPGVDIESSIPNGRTAVYSGTSMACPAVAGVLNHYIDMYPELNMKQLRDKLIKDSNKGMIKNNKRGTGDYLVYIDRHD